MQRKSICEPAITALGDRKMSIAMSNRTPSITSQSRPSLVGLLASKRFARHLTSKAMRKRSSIFDSGMPRMSHAPPVPAKEPTYRMAPERKFEVKKVENCIKDMLETRLSGFRYSPKLSANLSKVIGDEIKFKVKSLNFDRYKLVCNVLIGQLKDQAVQVASRCAWDDSLDSFATYTYKNDSIFCTAVVYGVYAE